MVAWNNAAANASSSGHGSGFIFNSPAAAMSSPVMFGHGHFFLKGDPSVQKHPFVSCLNRFFFDPHGCRVNGSPPLSFTGRDPPSFYWVCRFFFRQLLRLSHTSTNSGCGGAYLSSVSSDSRH
ncbi:hypothetical protein PIB30_046991 [Stylosanthes scabra]|uniref:Uncharacterized protein n=1 Tax=Stylosanthes scabra TaxID=79078 RepID=A0ABU6WIL0_9FABA|nr:hypothetical protein [Stylosanthes scabra]